MAQGTTAASTATRNPRTARAPAEVQLPGGWRLLAQLAAGRLSRVYLATHADSPADAQPAYAVKMLRADLSHDARALAFLRCEALVARVARHAHLITVLAEHIERPPYFLVMPRLEGESLDRRIAGRGLLPLALALSYARQVSQALAVVDRAGFVHGDVKPANIHVSRSGHATLIDLGFARQKGQQPGGGELALIGTPNYLAPELLRRNSEVDIRSDIYSLGVVLFEMLSGRLPYDVTAGHDTARLSAASTATRLRQLNPLVTKSVADLVAELLAVEPLRRPQTPDELVHRLVALEIEHLGDRI